MERGLPGRTLVFYPNFCTFVHCLQCHGSASPQCITVPPIVMALCGGGNRSLPLVAAAFNPLLPSQTLTATEAFDISFNILRTNSTSIQLLQ